MIGSCWCLFQSCSVGRASHSCTNSTVGRRNSARGFCCPCSSLWPTPPHYAPPRPGGAQPVGCVSAESVDGVWTHRVAMSDGSGGPRCCAPLSAPIRHFTILHPPRSAAKRALRQRMNSRSEGKNAIHAAKTSCHARNNALRCRKTPLWRGTTT